jgi:hypothetical protein
VPACAAYPKILTGFSGGDWVNVRPDNEGLYHIAGFTVCTAIECGHDNDNWAFVDEALSLICDIS